MTGTPHSLSFVSSLLDTSAPCAMDRAHMLHPISYFYLPCDVIRNFYNLQLRAVTVCLLAEFLHHAHELLVIARNQHAILIQTRFSWSGGFRPVGAKICLLKRLLLPEF